MLFSFRNWLQETAGDSWGTPPQQLGTTAQLAAVCTACPQGELTKKKGEEKIPLAMKKKAKKA